MRLTILLIVIGLFFGCSHYTEEQHNKLEAIVTELTPVPIFFKLSPDTAHLVQTTKNRYYRIPPNAFLYMDNRPVKESIQLSITEYNTLSEIIGQGLQTKNIEGQPLATAGMLHLEATSESGQPLKLAQGKAIYLQAQSTDKTNLSDGFDLYKGNLQGKTILWEQPTEAFANLQPTDYKNLFCLDQYDGGGHLPDAMCWQLDLAQYQNSLLATVPFFERSLYAIAYFNKKDKLALSVAAEKTITFFETKLSLPLYTIDSIFVHLLQEEMNQDEANKNLFLSLKEDYIKQFVKTKPLPTFVSPFDSIPIDTSFYNFLYKNDYQILCNTQQHMSSNEYTNQSYRIPFLGWYNIDRLLDQKYKQQSIQVVTNENYDNASVSL